MTKSTKEHGTTAAEASVAQAENHAHARTAARKYLAQASKNAGDTAGFTDTELEAHELLRRVLSGDGNAIEAALNL